ncbi:MAG: hypothetical protein JW870_12645 [Candidatus Delongbacteria bacterium]|nr:hypothetical protein [Candidatus Delongbacteria bacterium]
MRLIMNEISYLIDKKSSDVMKRYGNAYLDYKDDDRYGGGFSLGFNGSDNCSGGCC